jgi:hypothetical protein
LRGQRQRHATIACSRDDGLSDHVLGDLIERSGHAQKLGVAERTDHCHRQMLAESDGAGNRQQSYQV